MHNLSNNKLETCKPNHHMLNYLAGQPYAKLSCRSGCWLLNQQETVGEVKFNLFNVFLKTSKLQEKWKSAVTQKC